MVPAPRNRSPKSTTPRRQFVLKLNQIRCTECGASANVKYLRPFKVHQNQDGFLVLCRICQRAHLPSPKRFEVGPMTTAPASPLAGSSSRCAA